MFTTVSGIYNLSTYGKYYGLVWALTQNNTDRLVDIDFRRGEYGIPSIFD